MSSWLKFRSPPFSRETAPALFRSSPINLWDGHKILKTRQRRRRECHQIKEMTFKSGAPLPHVGQEACTLSPSHPTPATCWVSMSDSSDSRFKGNSRPPSPNEAQLLHNPHVWADLQQKHFLSWPRALRPGRSSHLIPTRNFLLSPLHRWKLPSAPLLSAF